MAHTFPELKSKLSLSCARSRPGSEHEAVERLHRN